MPDPLLSDSTKSLNQSGMFLQSLISKELDFDGWSVDTEYPVQIAPFTVDPIKHGNYSIDEYTKKPVYHPQDIIRSMEECKNKIELEETSIDVVGTIGNDPVITLCVECKKLDPIYSDWIFFDVSKPKPMNVIIKSLQSKGHISLFRIPSTSSCGNEIFVDLHKWEGSAPGLSKSVTNFSYGDEATVIQTGFEYSSTSITLPTITFSSQKAYVNDAWSNWNDFVNGRVGETDPSDAYVLECGNDYTTEHGEGSQPGSC